MRCSKTFSNLGIPIGGKLHFRKDFNANVTGEISMQKVLVVTDSEFGVSYRGRRIYDGKIVTMSMMSKIFNNGEKINNISSCFVYREDRSKPWQSLLKIYKDKFSLKKNNPYKKTKLPNIKVLKILFADKTLPPDMTETYLDGFVKLMSCFTEGKITAKGIQKATSLLVGKE